MNNLGKKKVEIVKNKNTYYIPVIHVFTPQTFKEVAQQKQRPLIDLKLISTQYTGYKHNKF